MSTPKRPTGTLVTVAWVSEPRTGSTSSTSASEFLDEAGVATLDITWRGPVAYVRSVSVLGRSIPGLTLTLTPGETRRIEVALPQPPLLEVHGPATSQEGQVSVHILGDRALVVEDLGRFDLEKRRRVTFQTLSQGRCRVQVRVALGDPDEDPEHYRFTSAEQEVNLRPGQRSVVQPTYTAWARLKIRVLRPNGQQLSSAMAALRCSTPASHDCRQAHQDLTLSRISSFAFGEEEDPEQVPEPAPLLEAQWANEVVHLAPGTYKVLVAGNDPDLSALRAEVTLTPGEDRTLELKLEPAHQVEVQFPPPGELEDLDITVEGPPGASAAFLPDRLLRIRGLAAKDLVRVTTRGWFKGGEEPGGEQVVLRAGARHSSRFVRATHLEVRVTEPDGTPSDARLKVWAAPPSGLQTYRRAFGSRDPQARAWLTGDSVGRGPRLSSILDSSEEDGLRILRVLPGAHVLLAEGGEPTPVLVTAGKATRVQIKLRD